MRDSRGRFLSRTYRGAKKEPCSPMCAGKTKSGKRRKCKSPCKRIRGSSGRCKMSKKCVEKYRRSRRPKSKKAKSKQKSSNPSKPQAIAPYIAKHTRCTRSNRKNCLASAMTSSVKRTGKRKGKSSVKKRMTLDKKEDVCRTSIKKGIYDKKLEQMNPKTRGCRKKCTKDQVIVTRKAQTTKSGKKVPGIRKCQSKSKSKLDARIAAAKKRVSKRKASKKK